MIKQKQPLVKNIYTADPSAHVFEGKSYIYPLYPFDVKKLKRSIFRVRLPHGKNN